MPRATERPLSACKRLEREGPVPVQSQRIDTMANELQGVFPILATTFNDDASLDLRSQAALIHHLMEAGAHGLGVFGNASEGYALLPEERENTLQFICH